MLELDEGQLSRPVLRGRGGSNTSLLPGCEKQARAPPRRKGGARRVCALTGRVARNSGEWRVASGERTVVSGQWPVNPAGLSWRCEKSAKTKPMEIGHKPFDLKE